MSVMSPDQRDEFDRVVREILVGLRTWQLGPNDGDCLAVGAMRDLDPLVFGLHAFYGATKSGSAAVAVVACGALAVRLRAHGRVEDADAVDAGPTGAAPPGAVREGDVVLCDALSAGPAYVCMLAETPTCLTVAHEGQRLEVRGRWMYKEGAWHCTVASWSIAPTARRERRRRPRPPRTTTELGTEPRMEKG